MTSRELENLAKIGKLKREEPTADEIRGLLESAAERLMDAARPDLAFASRFDLAYNAAHALALAALRRAGFRSDSRYLVFQVLEHAMELPAEKWRILAMAHERRNVAEYEGHLERDDKLLEEVIAVAEQLRKTLGSARVTG